MVLAHPPSGGISRVAVLSMAPKLACSSSRASSAQLDLELRPAPGPPLAGAFTHFCQIWIAIGIHRTNPLDCWREKTELPRCA